MLRYSYSVNLATQCHFSNFCCFSYQNHPFLQTHTPQLLRLVILTGYFNSDPLSSVSNFPQSLSAILSRWCFWNSLLPFLCPQTVTSAPIIDFSHLSQASLGPPSRTNILLSGGTMLHILGTLKQPANWYLENMSKLLHYLTSVKPCKQNISQ